jgi:hypothetical protein
MGNTIGYTITVSVIYYFFGGRIAKQQALLKVESESNTVKGKGGLR